MKTVGKGLRNYVLYHVRLAELLCTIQREEVAKEVREQECCGVFVMYVKRFRL